MDNSNFQLRLITSQEDIRQVEALQARVWGPQEVVPYHLLTASIHGGGVLIGAFEGSQLVGMVFGFPLFDDTGSGRVLRHHSHMLAVAPERRDAGIGFALKRAQWQWVRQQGIERITWTYDPLQSRNAHLNIARLGAVCSTYLPDYYGEMSDNINAGVPSDRFQVDWWVNSPRVQDRLKKKPRRPLEIGDYFSAGGEIVNPTRIGAGGFPQPAEETWMVETIAEKLGTTAPEQPAAPPFFLVEIPPNFSTLKEADLSLAVRWRQHTREVFTRLFARGYLVTDFIYMRGESPRSFYILSDGERRLGAFRKNRRRRQHEN